jgi:hypothetical protein
MIGTVLRVVLHDKHESIFRGGAVRAAREADRQRARGALQRHECLDVHWFATLTEAKQVIEAWRHEYNLVSYYPTSLCS